MRKIICLAFLLSVTNTVLADSAQGKKLFNRNSCNQCHIVSAPTPAKIAEKYQGKSGSAENLVNQFKAGAFNTNSNATVRHTAAVSGMSENDMQSVMQYLSGDASGSATSTASSTAKSDSSSGAAVLGAIGAVAGVYLENQEAKSNSRSRNAQVSQTVPQIETRTQTSQNNYPSDSTYEQGGSNQVSSGEEYVAHSCIVPNNKGGFKNICSYDVNFSYCIMNSQPLDPNVRMGDANTKCERSSLGSSSQRAGTESSGLYAGQWYWFACRSPAAVTNARFESGGISAYCKKY